MQVISGEAEIGSNDQTVGDVHSSNVSTEPTEASHVDTSSLFRLLRRCLTLGRKTVLLTRQTGGVMHVRQVVQHLLAGKIDASCSGKEYEYEVDFCRGRSRRLG